MIDGIHFRDHIILVALGIDAVGNKQRIVGTAGAAPTGSRCST